MQQDQNEENYSDFSEVEEKKNFIYLTDWGNSTGQSNLTYPAIFHGNSDLLAKRRRNGFIIQFE